MAPSSPALLTVYALHRTCARRRVRQSVGIAVPPGTLADIVGDDGAGNSMLLRIMGGESRADHGMVTCRGVIGYYPQVPVLSAVLLVARYLAYFAVAWSIDQEFRLRPAVAIARGRRGCGRWRSDRDRRDSCEYRIAGASSLAVAEVDEDVLEQHPAGVAISIGCG